MAKRTVGRRESRPRKPSLNAREALSPRYGIALLVLSLVAFGALVLSNILTTTATFDEPVHLFAGYSDVRWGDRRINPEHPPLLKKLAALPLLFMDVWPLSIEPPSSVDERSGGSTYRELRDSFGLALSGPGAPQTYMHHFLFGLRQDALDRWNAGDSFHLPPEESYTRRDFLNEPDRFLKAARIPIALIGVFLGLMIFLWSRELFGLAGAVLSAALYCFDPNFIGHSGVVTTDVGVSAFVFASAYFIWRAARRRTAGNVIGASILAGLAIISKYSALFMAPMLLGAAIWRIGSRSPWNARGEEAPAQSTSGRRALRVGAIVAAMVATAWLLIWAAYGFRYSAVPDVHAAANAEAAAISHSGYRPSGGIVPGGLPLESLLRQDAATAEFIAARSSAPYPDEVARWSAVARIDLFSRTLAELSYAHLLPEAFAYGVALTRFNSRARPGFLRGRHELLGFPSFFLWAFLFKTPLGALILLAIGIPLFLRSQGMEGFCFVLLPALVYFWIALTSGLNLGHRHILPVYPFLFVAAGALGPGWERLRGPRRPAAGVMALLLSCCGAFLVFVPPLRPVIVVAHHLSFMNELGGGPRGGYENLADSNFDWGQDLGTLARWLEAHHVREPINLCYFGTADPRYYGIRHRNLLGGYVFEADRELDALPGLLAMSASNLEGVIYAPQTRAKWAEFLTSRRAELVGRAGYSILIYRLH
jgi:4-amino-4-deoxy-L-arabinose transferase-like glycosyltransferase